MDDIYKEFFTDQFKKTELTRYWLIGNWIAKKLNKDFYLLNLVLSKANTYDFVENQIKPLIKEDDKHFINKMNWESIYEYVKNNNFCDEDSKLLMNYFENKTYYESNTLVKMFSVEGK